MPLALIHLGTKVSDEKKGEIAKEATNIFSEVLGKPIKYCSANVFETCGGFGGEIVPSVFIDIKSIGALKGKQKELSDKFCTLIENKTGVKGDKIYLNFTELTGDDWGYDHKNFGK